MCHVDRGGEKYLAGGDSGKQPHGGGALTALTQWHGRDVHPRNSNPSVWSRMTRDRGHPLSMPQHFY